MDSGKHSLRSLIVEIVGKEILPEGEYSYRFDTEYRTVNSIYKALYPVKADIIGEENKKVVVTFLKVFYEARFNSEVDSLLKKFEKNEALSKEELLKYADLLKKAYGILNSEEATYYDEIIKKQGILTQLLDSMLKMILLDVTIANINVDDDSQIHLDNLRDFIEAYHNSESLNHWRKQMEQTALKEKAIFLQEDKLLMEIKD